MQSLSLLSNQSLQFRSIVSSLISTSSDWPEARTSLVESYELWLSQFKTMLAANSLANVNLGTTEHSMMPKQNTASGTTSSVNSARELDEQRLEAIATERMDQTERLTAPRTPSRRSRKRAKVRFSDPGPEVEEKLDHCPDASTGLTPAVLRTVIHDDFNPTTSSA